MDEFIVITLTSIALIFVACGFMNRKRRRERDEGESLVNIMGTNTVHGINNAPMTDSDLFRAELSKAGFKDETINDMYIKILDKKGSASLSDAVYIIRTLDYIMNLSHDAR